MAKNIVTGEVRLSFVNLLEPKVQLNDDGTPGAPKYSVMLLIPKNTKAGKDTYEKLRAAEAEAKEAGKAKWGGVVPKKLKTILHDGDAEDAPSDKYPEIEGHWYMTVQTTVKYPPKVVGRDLQPIMDATEVYSGMYARVSVQPFAYSAKGNQGISFGLGNVQKLRDGEPLGGVAARPEDEFEALEDDENAGLI